MSDPSSPVVSQERIRREIRERERKATKGPWVADDFCEEDDQALRVGTTDGTSNYYHSSATVAICAASDEDDRDDDPRIGLLAAEANAQFIAHARVDIPWLLSALDVALARAAAAEQQVGELQADREFSRQGIETLEAELSRLRAERTWQPIETADADTPVVLFTPRKRLTDLPVHIAPDIKAEIRVSAPRYWTWATHWQPLPSPPGASQE